MKVATEDKAVKSPKDAESLLLGGSRSKNSTITFEDIEQRAYQIWQENGCRHGGDMEDWLQAEYELEAEENLAE